MEIDLLKHHRVYICYIDSILIVTTHPKYFKYWKKEKEDDQYKEYAYAVVTFELFLN